MNGDLDDFRISEPERLPPHGWQPTTLQRLPPTNPRLLSAIRNALAEYEIKRGNESHTSPRCITSRHIQEFTESVAARLEEGGS